MEKSNFRNQELVREIERLRDRVDELEFELDHRVKISRGEELYHSVIEQFPVMVYELDLSGYITFLNKKGRELTGLTQDALKAGVHLSEHFPPEERERLMAYHAKVKRGQTLEKEYSAQRKDGTRYPALDTCLPIFRGDAVVGLRGIVLDISEQRKTEEQLAESQKRELIGTLASGIAHDINNLLAAITGLAELMITSFDKDDTRRKDALEILEIAMRGGEFTRNLLGFARQGKFRKVHLSVNKMAGQVLKIIKRTLSKKPNIYLDLDPALREVEGDPGQITNVLMNLCLNAAEAIDDQGNIWISTRNIDLSLQQARKIGPAIKPGSYVKLQVRDNGKGMDKETIERIFEPFFSTKGPAEGTGLGLAMVEGVVINHGGSLAVQSKKHRGTTFDVFLPALSAVKRIEKPRSIQPARPADPNRTYTVLLVDDERILRSTGQRLLKTLGYDVLLAENGARAIQVFKEHQETIDLVILDLAMPVMDGPECFKRLQKLKPTSRIVIASGVAHGYITENLLERGAKGFLRKPYTLEHLKRAVARALDVLPENPPN